MRAWLSSPLAAASQRTARSAAAHGEASDTQSAWRTLIISTHWTRRLNICARAYLLGAAASVWRSASDRKNLKEERQLRKLTTTKIGYLVGPIALILLHGHSDHAPPNVHLPPTDFCWFVFISIESHVHDGRVFSERAASGSPQQPARSRLSRSASSDQRPATSRRHSHPTQHRHTNTPTATHLKKTEQQQQTASHTRTRTPPRSPPPLISS